MEAVGDKLLHIAPRDAVCWGAHEPAAPRAGRVAEHGGWRRLCQAWVRAGRRAVTWQAVDMCSSARVRWAQELGCGCSTIPHQADHESEAGCAGGGAADNADSAPRLGRPSTHHPERNSWMQNTSRSPRKRSNCWSSRAVSGTAVGSRLRVPNLRRQREARWRAGLWVQGAAV